MEPDLSIDDFEFLQELGRGSFGIVYKVKHIPSSTIQVAKKINTTKLTQKSYHEAMKEVNILKQVDHNNIIRYYGSFISGNYLYIVMEFAEGGDLQNLIKMHRHKKKRFSEKELWMYGYEISLAISFLHSKNIIHRDIKCLNLFLNAKNHIKLGDLGSSKITTPIAQMHGTRVGTPIYLAPELVKQTRYDFKVDIWALGCVLYHLAALNPPFLGDNLIQLGQAIWSKKPRTLSDTYSTRFSDMVNQLLSKNPNDRPNIQQVIKMIPTSVKNQYVEPAPPPHYSALSITRNSEIVYTQKTEAEPSIAQVLPVEQPQTLSAIDVTESAPAKPKVGPEPDSSSCKTSVKIRPLTNVRRQTVIEQIKKSEESPGALKRRLSIPEDADSKMLEEIEKINAAVFSKDAVVSPKSGMRSPKSHGSGFPQSRKQSASSIRGLSEIEDPANKYAFHEDIDALVQTFDSSPNASRQAKQPDVTQKEKLNPPIIIDVPPPEKQDSFYDNPMHQQHSPVVVRHGVRISLEEKQRLREIFERSRQVDPVIVVKKGKDSQPSPTKYIRVKTQIKRPQSAAMLNQRKKQQQIQLQRVPQIGHRPITPCTTLLKTSRSQRVTRITMMARSPLAPKISVRDLHKMLQ